MARNGKNLVAPYGRFMVSDDLARGTHPWLPESPSESAQEAVFGTRMKPIPGFRAAHLMPYIDFLLEVGAPVERGLRHARLPVLLREQPDAYLPQHPTLSFLNEMSRSEGIEDFGVRVLQGLRMKDFSEPFAIAASRSPTLKTALDKFRELVHLEDNYLSFWITAAGTTARLHMVNSFPIEARDLQYEDWNEIMVLIAIVRTFAGQTWVPELGAAVPAARLRWRLAWWPAPRRKVREQTGGRSGFGCRHATRSPCTSQIDDRPGALRAEKRDCNGTHRRLTPPINN